MVLDGLVNTSEMVTHQLPLSRIDEAFRIRNESAPETIHVLVDCEE
jgi:threonine dehydrogenase-like Zn-dependent dehydrogenase